MDEPPEAARRLDVAWAKCDELERLGCEKDRGADDDAPWEEDGDLQQDGRLTDDLGSCRARFYE